MLQKSFLFCIDSACATDVEYLVCIIVVLVLFKRVEMQQNRSQNLTPASSYLVKVKDTFRDQPQVYNDFLNVMKMVKSGRINSQEMRRSVSDLFRGHPELIIGCNLFFPPEWRMPVPNEEIQDGIPDDESSTIVRLILSGAQEELDHLGFLPSIQAFNYFNQIKSAFANQLQVYFDFLDTLKAFVFQKIDQIEMIERVLHLFRGHPVLLICLNQFLLPGYKVEVQPNEQVTVRIIDPKSCGEASSTGTVPIHLLSFEPQTSSLDITHSQFNQ